VAYDFIEPNLPVIKKRVLAERELIRTSLLGLANRGKSSQRHLRIAKAALGMMGMLEYLELSIRICNKVWLWRDLERFIMLGKDESRLHDDEFSFFNLRYFYKAEFRINH